MVSRILRILDKDTVIANVNSYEVEIGDEFIVFDEKESEIIRDPDTKKAIGSLPVPKGMLVISEIYKNFSILKIKSEIYDPIRSLSYGQQISTEPRFKAVKHSGRVDEMQIEPVKNKSNSPIKIGDKLKKVIW